MGKGLAAEVKESVPEKGRKRNARRKDTLKEAKILQLFYDEMRELQFSVLIGVVLYIYNVFQFNLDCQ